MESVVLNSPDWLSGVGLLDRLSAWAGMHAIEANPTGTECRYEIATHVLHPPVWSGEAGDSRLLQ
jgi:hypothetical protein